MCDLDTFTDADLLGLVRDMQGVGLSWRNAEEAALDVLLFDTESPDVVAYVREVVLRHVRTVGRLRDVN